MKIRPDVVFDCNVLFQAMTSENGPSARALALVEQRRISLHVCRQVLRELRRILEYPEIRERNPHLTPAVVEAFMERLCFRGSVARTVPHVFDFPRDPKDEPYLDLAAATGADYLVTRDKNLLSLMTDHSSIGNEFRQKISGLKILDPMDFMDEILRLGMEPDAPDD